MALKEMFLHRAIQADLETAQLLEQHGLHIRAQKYRAGFWTSRYTEFDGKLKAV